VCAARISRALGGRRSGNGYLAPCPVHQDRKPSLSLRDGTLGLLVHCFAGCDPRHVLAELRHCGLLDLAEGGDKDDGRTNYQGINKNEGRAKNASPPKTSHLRADRNDNHADYERRQHEKAAWLWTRRYRIIGTVAERYLRARGYHGSIPSTLGFLPASRGYPPAIIAAFGEPEEPEPGILAAPRAVIAVHITRLKPDGSDRERGLDAKLMIGRSIGSPIVLAPVNDLLGLAITEGIEDALSVKVATGLGTWAAASAGRMPPLADIVPPYVETVTIFAHPEKIGQDKACELAKKLHGRGIETFIEGLPP
jgi:Toprim domain